MIVLLLRGLAPVVYKGLPLEKFNSNLFTVDMPSQQNLYEKYFLGQGKSYTLSYQLIHAFSHKIPMTVHSNYVGKTDEFGPVVISVVDDSSSHTIRALIREAPKTHYLCTEYRNGGIWSSKRNALKIILEKCTLELPRRVFCRVKHEAVAQKEINAFDASHVGPLLKLEFQFMCLMSLSSW